MSNNITFSQMLTITITPLNDIQKANDKKEHYNFMGYEFKDEDKLSVQYSSKKTKQTFKMHLILQMNKSIILKTKWKTINTMALINITKNLI